MTYRLKMWENPRSRIGSKACYPTRYPRPQRHLNRGNPFHSIVVTESRTSDPHRLGNAHRGSLSQRHMTSFVVRTTSGKAMESSLRRAGQSKKSALGSWVVLVVFF